MWTIQLLYKNVNEPVDNIHLGTPHFVISPYLPGTSLVVVEETQCNVAHLYSEAKPRHIDIVLFSKSENINLLQDWTVHGLGYFVIVTPRYI